MFRGEHDLTEADPGGGDSQAEGRHQLRVLRGSGLRWDLRRTDLCKSVRSVGDAPWLLCCGLGGGSRLL